jgi:hypothetical protein
MNMKKIIASIIILSSGLIALLITSPASSLQELLPTIPVYLPYIEKGVTLTFTPTRTPTRTVTRTSTATPTRTPTRTVTRTLTRTVTRTPTRTATKTNAPAVCNCTGPDLNCTHFGTHAAAQACFNYCVSQGYGDIFSLDSDGDGLACESLPAPPAP